jgi:hypothetical protein
VLECCKEGISSLLSSSKEADLKTNVLSALGTITIALMCQLVVILLCFVMQYELIFLIDLPLEPHGLWMHTSTTSMADRPRGL